jgi:hypothetical protein
MPIKKNLIKRVASTLALFFPVLNNLWRTTFPMRLLKKKGRKELNEVP